MWYRENLDEWDPMKFDYASKDFNSYGDGPGQRLATRDQKDVVTLFVDNIPAMITKVKVWYFTLHFLGSMLC